jgi:hypothetical protein
MTITDVPQSGLAWHTDENALRQKFEDFGKVEEAVSYIFLIIYNQHARILTHFMM